MSSLPASPHPQRPRELPGGAASRPPAPAADPAEPAAPSSAPVPVPPMLVRIPYREWKGPRPRAVGLSSALIVLAGIISLVGGITDRALLPDLSSAVIQLERIGIDLTRYAAVFQALALAATLVVFGLYLLFAFLIRDGRNWARVGGTVLAGPALVAALAAGDVPQVFAVLAAAGGLALLYRSDCSRYFRPRRAQYRSTGS